MDTVSPDRLKAQRVALLSFLAALVLVALKLTAGLAANSLALISEAIHSGLDAGATLMTLIAVKIASRPPDHDHPYGHGKAENIAALIETLLLVGLAIVIASEAIERLAGGNIEAEAAWYTFAVMGFAIIVEANRSVALRRAGRKYRSPALEADALHFTADFATSAVVLVGLGVVALGYPAADALAGLGVAIYVGLSSVRLGRRSIDVLMDRAPTASMQRVKESVSEVPGVEEVRRVRLRYAGGQPQADVVVAISRTLPLEAAHAVTEEIESAVAHAISGAEVVVHVEPLADEELIREQVSVIAARDSRVSQVHNIHAANLDDGLHISLHAKFPGEMGLADAHEIAEKLEGSIASEIEGVARVDTHLEPLEASEEKSENVTEQRAALVASATALAEGHSEVRNCHEVFISSSDEGLSLLMHCEAAPGLSVDQVHAVSTQIENQVHSRWPDVLRVTVHFEPVGTQ